VVLKKLSRALEEFGAYINNNAEGIVNYGERYRCGSSINQVITKRFVKKQQMRWRPGRRSSFIAGPGPRAR
jgi:hypothetical protein